MAKATTATKVPPGKPSIIEELKKLDADRAKLDEARKGLLEHAKNELLAQGKTVVEGLKKLGFIYTLTATVKKSHHKQLPKDKVVKQPGGCTICNFHTRPEHDRRAHRHLKEKKPFSPEELEKRGMVRV